MAKANTYETQSQWSVYLSAGGGAALLAGAAAVFSAFNMHEFAIFMRPNSARFFAVLITVLVGASLGGIGALLGFNSAEQKRNTRSKQAWMGFAIGSAVATLSVCLGIFFWLTKDFVRQ